MPEEKTAPEPKTEERPDQATNEVKPDQETETTTDPIDALTAKLDEKIQSVSREEDPLDLYGIDEEFKESDRTPPEPPDEDAEKQSWKQRAIEAERQLINEERRNKLGEVMGKVKDLYPNAYEPTVQRAIRQGVSPEAIEARAKASHLDYGRGYAAAMGEAKVEIATLKESAAAEAQAETRENWGGPPGNVPSPKASKKDLGDLIFDYSQRKVSED